MINPNTHNGMYTNNNKSYQKNIFFFPATVTDQESGRDVSAVCISIEGEDIYLSKKELAEFCRTAKKQF